MQDATGPPRKAARENQQGILLLPDSVRGMLLLILLIVLLPVILIQTAVYESLYKQRRAEEYQSNLEIARTLAVAFEAYTTAILHNESALGLVTTTATAPSPELIGNLLTKNTRTFPSLLRMDWTDAQGRIIASSAKRAEKFPTEDLSEIRPILRGRNWAISNLVRAPDTGKPIFTIAQGIRTNDKSLRGIIVAAVDPDRLSEVLAVHRPAHGTIEIIDRHGMNVTKYPPADVSWDQRHLMRLNALLQGAIAGHEESGVFRSPDDHRKRLAGLAPIEPCGFVAVATRPVDTVMQPITRDLYRDISLMIFTSLAALFNALMIGRNLTRPLYRLGEYAVAVGKGRYNDHIEVAHPRELHALAEALNRMNRELREREVEREMAVHIMSHDLRAPLTSILGHAQQLQHFLQMNEFDGQARVSTEAIARGARRMNAMIQDLVDVTRLEGGQFALHLAPVNVGDFLDDMLKRSAISMNVKRIRLEIPPALPRVYTDSDRLERVLTNLLSNALKYSPESTPVIVRGYARENDVVIAISDQGIGIHPEDLSRIFERFFRARDTRQLEGIGLGLYITRLLVEALGGSVWVESTPDKGSTFSFTLPIAGASE